MKKSVYDSLAVFGGGASTIIGRQASALKQNLSENSYGAALSSVGLESADDTSLATLNRSFEGLTAGLESVAGIAPTIGGESPYGVVGRNAAAQGMAIALNAGKHMRATANGFGASLESGDSFGSTDMGVGTTIGRMDGVVAAVEAYDQVALQETAVYTALFNMRHGNQSEFAEAFFGTVLVNTDQAGYMVSMNVVSVYDEVRRHISGRTTDFRRRNIIHAMRDPEILSNDQTLNVPVHRTESAALFAPISEVPVRDQMVGGQIVKTSALRFGQEFDLLAISQTDALIETGVLDSTDALDSAQWLQTVYLKLSSGGTTEVLPIRVKGLPQSNFTAPQQGNYRRLILDFQTEAPRLSGSNLTVQKAESTLLEPLRTGKLSVRLKFSVNGSLETERGLTTLSANNVRVARIFDENGDTVALSDPSVADIITLIESGSLAYFDLYGYRTDSNIRQRGKLLDNTYNRQVFPVHLRTPITVPRPQSEAEQNDASDVAALLSAAAVITTNAAIDKLFETSVLMKEHAAAREKFGVAPTVIGIAYGPVDLFYEEADINIDSEMGNLTSAEKAEDLRMTMINRIRDVAIRAYRESGYQQAADARAGGRAPKPTVLVGTDQVVGAWLFVQGDTRLMGDEFNYKVVTTPNEKMDDTIFVTFIDETDAKSGKPNPMTFGNMGYRPEIVVNLPIHFNGANSRQLSVQPAFSHNVNLPVLAKFTVKGLSAALAVRTPLAVDANTTDVTPPTGP